MSMDLGQCDSAIIFGGSFDPPHIAHVLLPERARLAIGADAIAYVPAAISPLKQQPIRTDARHRLAMLQLALRRVEHAVIITAELERAADGRPSYTVETLQALHQKYPRLHMRLLIGADQLAQFDRWRDPQRIIALAEPLVMVRPPATRESVLAALPSAYDRQTWQQRLVDVPLVEASSSAVRRRIAAGEDAQGMIDPAVETYIREHHLYEAS